MAHIVDTLKHVTLEEYERKIFYDNFVDFEIIFTRKRYRFVSSPVDRWTKDFVGDESRDIWLCVKRKVQHVCCSYVDFLRMDTYLVRVLVVIKHALHATKIQLLFNWGTCCHMYAIDGFYQLIIIDQGRMILTASWRKGRL